MKSYCFPSLPRVACLPNRQLLDRLVQLEGISSFVQQDQVTAFAKMVKAAYESFVEARAKAGQASSLEETRVYADVMRVAEKFAEYSKAKMVLSSLELSRRMSGSR